MARPFLDTNVLIYAISDDPRGNHAAALLAQRCDTSVQALNEFAAVARRKLAMAWPEIRAALADFQQLCHTIHAIELESHRTALRLCQEYSLSFYDGVMVATALHAGAELLLTEDMQDGLVVDGRLTLRNPFKIA